MTLTANSIMKKIFSVVIFFSLLSYSCKKLDDKSNQVNEDAISAVTNARTTAEMKNSYALLTSAEKLAIWNLHFESFVSENNLTQEQLNFISDFKQQWLQIELFDRTSDLFNNFNSQIPTIKGNAMTLLGVDDTYSLLFNLDLAKRATQLQIALEPGYDLSDNDCHCSKSDPYCNVGSCNGGGCKESSWGCGTLWFFSCTGNCKFL